MRVVAWNCAMALDRKWPALDALAPDIAVISECARPERLRAAGMDLPPRRIAWTGPNEVKGLAVIARPPFRVRRLPVHDPALPHVMPVEVRGAGLRFTVLAVWAQNASGGFRRRAEPGPFNRALDRYGWLAGQGPLIAAGDFNNHERWDRPGHAINFAENVARCRRLGLVSAYHLARGEPFGAESEPTHYWRDRREDGPVYHIDYLFFSARWQPRLRRFGIGPFADFCAAGLSDHAPLAADFDLGRGARSAAKPVPSWLLPVRRRSARNPSPLNGATGAV
ncbi:endonuclease/exonuclease/phosphatase family protein [Minwuia thermotolerans]|nr:endonuclease/exonuclease/phosphatase family protein [Minwuia thermotolerans]